MKIEACNAQNGPQLATFKTRFFASLLDFIILFIFSIPIAAFLSLIFLNIVPPSIQVYAMPLTFSLLIVMRDLNFKIGSFSFSGFAKRNQNICVIQNNGLPIDFFTSLIRNIVFLFPIIWFVILSPIITQFIYKVIHPGFLQYWSPAFISALIFLPASFIWFLWLIVECYFLWKNNERLGDIWAGTIVIVRGTFRGRNDSEMPVDAINLSEKLSLTGKLSFSGELDDSSKERIKNWTEEGEKEGYTLVKIEIVRRMLVLDIEIDQINQLTNLTLEQITKIRDIPESLRQFEKLAQNRKNKWILVGQAKGSQDATTEVINLMLESHVDAEQIEKFTGITPSQLESMFNVI